MKQTLSLNNITLYKHNRIALLCWGDLITLTDAQVNAELHKLLDTTDDETIKTSAAFAAFNPGSHSFDYPAEDHTRCLLGAIQSGQIEII